MSWVRTTLMAGVAAAAISSPLAAPAQADITDWDMPERTFVYEMHEKTDLSYDMGPRANSWHRAGPSART